MMADDQTVNSIFRAGGSTCQICVFECRDKLSRGGNSAEVSSDSTKDDDDFSKRPKMHDECHSTLSIDCDRRRRREKLSLHTLSNIESIIFLDQHAQRHSE